MIVLDCVLFAYSRENKQMERQNSLQSYDIDNLTDISEVTSRKFEEEKDRNALLKAHLDDIKKRDKKLAKKVMKTLTRIEFKFRVF